MASKGVKLPTVEPVRTLDGGRVARITWRSRHYYVVGEEIVPSPTTVLGATLAPRELTWAMVSRERDRVVEAAVRAYRTAIGGGPCAPEQYLELLRNELRAASAEPSATALGSEIHARIAAAYRRDLYGEDIPLPDVSPKAEGLLGGIRRWWGSNIAAVHHVEVAVVGTGWAGTLDVLAQLYDGSHHLLDLKVSRAREPVVEWLVQASVYANAAAERYRVKAIPGILLVGSETGEVKHVVVEDPKRWVGVFHSALAMYRELMREELAELAGIIRSLRMSAA